MIGVVDANTWIGSWPFRYHDPTGPHGLSAQLEAEDIDRALVSSFDAIFNQDYVRSNNELFELVHAYSRLVPVPIIDPTVGGWQRQISSWVERGAGAIRILPSYHSYELDDGRLDPLIETIGSVDRLPLMIQIRVEDERSHHPRVQVPFVTVDALVAFAKRHPDLTVVALGALYHEAVPMLKETKNVYVDISFLETFRTIRTLLSEAPVSRVLFGSHAPLLVTRAALMKLNAPYVAVEDRRRIGSENVLSIARIS